MEDWRDGKLEGWKLGRVEDWLVPYINLLSNLPTCHV
jgi:hypothetical protein